MQANYPNKLPLKYWDPVHLEYPVRRFAQPELSSESIGRQWRCPPEVLRELKAPIAAENAYTRDYNITKNLTKSQTAADFQHKISETERFNKHTSCGENLYIYSQYKKLTERTPAHTAYGTSEMRSAFTRPCTAARLINEKNQFKHPNTLPRELPSIYPANKEIEPLDTTHEGFEKYLDPYLTTNRLHHRPFTADQLNRSSNTKDILTYYSFSNIPWVRTPKPNIQTWRIPLGKSKSVYDREKFIEGFREIRTHNKLNWVPRSFLTEVRDNYVEPNSRPVSGIHNYEEDVRSSYQRAISSLQTNIQQHDSAVQKMYTSENSHYGSKKPLSTVIDQFGEKNKRLVCKSGLA